MKSLGLMLLILGGAAAVAGCNKCGGGEASCISPGYYRYTPAGLPSPLVEVTADSPCVAELGVVGGDGSQQLLVTDDLATQGTVCVLHGRLADGQVVTATVTFGRPTDSCCVTYAPSGGEFTLSDAGVGGG